MRVSLPVAGLQRLWLLCLAITLAGCAVTPPASPMMPRARIGEFSLQARLAITRGPERASVSIDWEHQRGRDAIEVFSPLGQTVARLYRDDSGALLETSDRQVLHAPDLDQLAERALGARLPLSGLPHWVLGRALGADASGERDARGRWIRLMEAGWLVVFSRYESDAPDALPQLIDLQREDVSIRIRPDQWRVRP